MAHDGQARADAALFLADALVAARKAMSGNPAEPAEAAYLAVFALLAARALFPEVVGKPNPDLHRVMPDGFMPIPAIGS